MFLFLFFVFVFKAAAYWDPQRSVTTQSSLFSAYCPPAVFSLLSGGKCDKVAFSSPAAVCLALRTPLRSQVGGGAAVALWHTADCFTQGYRKVRSKINEETAARAAPGSAFCCAAAERSLARR